MGNREETEPSERAEKQGRRKGTRKKGGERQKKGVEQALQRTRVVGSFALAENPRR
jgi:hypothetical protein